MLILLLLISLWLLLVGFVAVMRKPHFYLDIFLSTMAPAPRPCIPWPPNWWAATPCIRMWAWDWWPPPLRWAAFVPRPFGRCWAKWTTSSRLVTKSMGNLGVPHNHSITIKKHSNVGIATINHPFLMVCPTHLWRLGGWFIIAIPTLLPLDNNYVH